MKQFTRRNSKSQIQSTDCDKEKYQAQQANKAAERLPSAAAADLSADPYSFDIDDSIAQPDRALQHKLDNKLPQPPQNKLAKTAVSAKASDTASTAAPGRQLLGKASGTAAASNRPGSPSKQPKPAAAKPLVVVDNQKVKHNTQQAGPAHTATAPKQPSPAAPTDQPRTAAPGRGGERGAASSGKRAGTVAAGGGSSGGARNRNGPSNASLNQAASSGGTSRRPSATAGAKRSRGTSDAAGGSQQQQPQRSSSSPPGSAGLTSPGPSQPTGAVSLPTPHRRPRLSAGLLGAAAGPAATEARPAQTVMEAQERGELVQLQDDASYAMDGLASTCSIDSQRDSAVTLTEMLSTRKGRVALRADGLAQQFLTNLAKLKASKDCVLNLAATLSLWQLASEDANPCYLASVAAAVLLDQLLQYDYSFDDVAAKSPAGAKLCRLLRGRPLVNLLASTGVASTRGLLLITLEQATSSQYASKAAAVEKLKHNLRAHGALQRLAGLVADTAAAPGGPLAAAQQLHLLLLVLENATFTCPENGATLVELQVTPGSKGSSRSKQQKQQQQSQGSTDCEGSQQPPQPFPAVLVGVAQQLLQGVDQEQARAALHVVLSVLMNLIHGNHEGGALICNVGGMDVAANIYTTLLQPPAGRHDTLCAAVLQHLDLLSVALGVLINLVSTEPQHSRKLAAAQTAVAGAAAGSSAAAAAAAAGGGGGVSSFVGLLCTVVSALGHLLQQHMEQEDAAEQRPAAVPSAAAAAGSGPEGGSSGLPAGAQVVTGPTAAAEALGSNTASEASIVEVYSGMLLGFLVRDGDPALAQAVAAQLPGNSLEALTSATGRCLDFYVRTGAITDHTRVTLEELLRHLVAVKASMAGGAGGAPVAGGGGAAQRVSPAASHHSSDESVDDAMEVV